MTIYGNDISHKISQATAEGRTGQEGTVTDPAGVRWWDQTKDSDQFSPTTKRRRPSGRWQPVRPDLLVITKILCCYWDVLVGGASVEAMSLHNLIQRQSFSASKSPECRSREVLSPDRTSPCGVLATQAHCPQNGPSHTNLLGSLLNSSPRSSWGNSCLIVIPSPSTSLFSAALSSAPKVSWRGSNWINGKGDGCFRAEQRKLHMGPKVDPWLSLLKR